MKVEIRKTKKCIECHNDSGKGWLKPNSPDSQASLVLFYFFLFTPTILFYTGITHLTIQTPAVVILYSLIRVSRGKGGSERAQTSLSIHHSQWWAIQ